MTDQRTTAVIDRENARAFRIACRLDARTFEMLQDIEQTRQRQFPTHAQVHRRRKRHPDTAPGTVAQRHRGVGDRDVLRAFSLPGHSWPDVSIRP